MNNWERRKISSFAEVVGGGTPSRKKEDIYFGGNIPWLSPRDLSDHNSRFVSRGAENITEKGLNNSSAKLLPKNAILFSSRATIGNVAIAKNPLTTSQGFRSLVCKDGKANPDFIYYALQYYTPNIEQIASGATYKEISGSDLADFEIDLPPLDTQQKIASILSAFDDLIENNVRRIAILEEMAMRIYREWFVHFRFPYAQGRRRSKALATERSGEQAIPADSKPKMVDSGTELGAIPEGWEVKKLEDVADINPENISTDYKGEIEYINISGVNEGSIDETEMHDFEEAPGRAKRRVKHGDIIWSSVRPNLKAYALILNPPSNQIASTGFAVIRPNKLPASFLYNFSTTEYFVQYLVNHTRGSAYPAVNVSDFKNAPILVPDEKLVEKFDKSTWSNYQQIDKLSRKNKKLKETRDLLLPKLISGKVDVEEITVN